MYGETAAKSRCDDLQILPIGSSGNEAQLEQLDKPEAGGETGKDWMCCDERRG